MTAVHSMDQGEKLTPFLLQFCGHPLNTFVEKTRRDSCSAKSNKVKAVFAIATRGCLLCSPWVSNF